MESCKDGDIPFVVQSPAPQVSFMPELCVFDTPCVFDDIEEARAAIDDPEFFSVIQGSTRTPATRSWVWRTSVSAS